MKKYKDYLIYLVIIIIACLLPFILEYGLNINNLKNAISSEQNINMFQYLTYANGKIFILIYPVIVSYFSVKKFHQLYHSGMLTQICERTNYKKYLTDTFCNSKSLLDIEVDSLHKDVDYKELGYSYKSKDKKEEEVNETNEKVKEIQSKKVNNEEKRVDEVREDNRVITLDEDIKSKLKQYLSEISLLYDDIDDLIDKSKTFNYLLEKIDEDEKEVIKEINQFIILQKV